MKPGIFECIPALSRFMLLGYFFDREEKENICRISSATDSLRMTLLKVPTDVNSKICSHMGYQHFESPNRIYMVGFDCTFKTKELVHA